MEKPLLIVGTGAMAHLFAARLSKVREVHILGAWEAGLARIEAEGIRVQELDGAHSRGEATVWRNPEKLKGVGLALVLVKSWQTAQAVSSLVGCLDGEGLVLTLQNGLGNLPLLEEGLGVARSALGVTTTGATLIEPGYVRHGGDGPITVGPHPRIDPMIEVLLQAGFKVERQDDLQGLIWSKLAVNAAINPLTALLEVPNGRLLEYEATRAVMGHAAQEVAELSSALGIQLSTNDLAGFAEQVASRTSENISSMLQDIRRGAPTEIDAICGAIARIAQENGIETPTNWGLWKLVKAKAALKMES